SERSVVVIVTSSGTGTCSYESRFPPSWQDHPNHPRPFRPLVPLHPLVPPGPSHLSVPLTLSLPNATLGTCQSAEPVPGVARGAGVVAKSRSSASNHWRAAGCSTRGSAQRSRTRSACTSIRRTSCHDSSPGRRTHHGWASTDKPRLCRTSTASEWLTASATIPPQLASDVPPPAEGLTRPSHSPSSVRTSSGPGMPGQASLMAATIFALVSFSAVIVSRSSVPPG